MVSKSTLSAPLDLFVIAVERDLRYLRWDWTSEGVNYYETSVITSVEPEHVVNRFNDGKCDAVGRLVAGKTQDRLRKYIQLCSVGTGKY